MTNSKRIVEERNFLSIFLERLLLLLSLIFVLMLPSVVFDGFVNKTVTSKIIFFQYFCVTLIGVSTLRTLFDKNLVIRFTKLDCALVVLLCYFIINSYFIQSDYGFSLRFYELIGLIFFYLVWRIIPRLYFYWILLAVLLSGSIQAVYGNLQLLGYYPSYHSLFNITGSFFNPGPYAGFLAVVWFLSLGCHLYREEIGSGIVLSLKSTQTLQKKGVQWVFGHLPIICR